MIAFVEGPVVALRDTSAVLAVAGVGLEVFAPRATLDVLTIGKSARLETFLLVREDVLALYGFLDVPSLELFKLLLTVSGIGPRLALAALSAFSPEGIGGAILAGDVAFLSSTPGIGKKTAERIVLELQSKLPDSIKHSNPSKTKETSALRDALEALMALGYREAQVRGVLQKILEQETSASTETLIRKALAKLK